MSGFFTIRREIVSRLAPRLSPDAFKILVDVILSADSLSIVEAPTLFRRRNAGESKLTLLVGVDFLGWLFIISPPVYCQLDLFCLP
jgi:dolichol-phosphate mannosyltransferase